MKLRFSLGNKRRIRQFIGILLARFQLKMPHQNGRHFL